MQSQVWQAREKERKEFNEEKARFEEEHPGWTIKSPDRPNPEHVPVYLKEWNLTPEGLLRQGPPAVSTERYEKMTPTKRAYYHEWKQLWDAQRNSKQ